MEQPTSALFDVFLRLRPSAQLAERFLNVEPINEHGLSTHVTVHPPAGDSRKRAVERFAFTRIFHEDAGQAEVFSSTGITRVIQNVVGCHGDGRDGTIATLGVTGSGKVCSMSVGAKGRRLMAIVTYHTRQQDTAWHNTDDAGCALRTDQIPPCTIAQFANHLPIVVSRRRERGSTRDSEQLPRIDELRCLSSIEGSDSSIGQSVLQKHMLKLS